MLAVRPVTVLSKITIATGGTTKSGPTSTNKYHTTHKTQHTEQQNGIYISTLKNEPLLTTLYVYPATHSPTNSLNLGNTNFIPNQTLRMTALPPPIPGGT